MVKGLDVFKAHFEPYADQYILIGGSACDWRFEQKALPFRATKDLDIVLIVEALTAPFVMHFWEFIKAGKYNIAQVGERKCFYRFVKPGIEEYPQMIELFARKPDAIKTLPGFHITDIPTGEEASSLSAILLDDNYYQFTIANSEVVDGLHIADDIALICLKARAFLNNRQRKVEGHQVREVDIVKHKNDVIKLAATLAADSKVATPDVVRADIQQYVQIVREENPDVKAILKPMGLGNIPLPEILNRLATAFDLAEILS